MNEVLNRRKERGRKQHVFRPLRVGCYLNSVLMMLKID